MLKGASGSVPAPTTHRLLAFAPAPFQENQSTAARFGESLTAPTNWSGTLASPIHCRGGHSNLPATPQPTPSN